MKGKRKQKRKQNLKSWQKNAKFSFHYTVNLKMRKADPKIYGFFTRPSSFLRMIREFLSRI